MLESEVIPHTAIRRQKGMAERCPVEDRIAFDDLRKGVFGIFVGKTRERAERLDLASGFHPDRQSRAAARAPRLEGESDMGSPHQKRGDRCKELIGTYIASVDEAMQGFEFS